MQEVLFSMEDISIRYPGKEPIEHINFKISEGEQLALTGENTAFLTSFMDAIAGKAIISKGKIQYREGLSPKDFLSYLSSSQKFKNNTGESYYQQRYNSLDSEKSSTVFEFLNNISPKGRNAYWNLEKLTEKLYLNELLNEHVIQLSNGETRRVLMAAAILKNPAILLLDNPFTGIDVNARTQISEIICEVAKSGITVIMATSANEIPDCITRILIFEKDNKISDYSKQDFYKGITVTNKRANKGLLITLMRQKEEAKFEHIVKMDNVTIRYGESVILNRVNWIIRPGERWLLSGPNGAGKTTLLSLINADNPQAFANNIILFDRKKGSGESIWEIKKKIGFFSAELFEFFPGHTTCIAAVESGFYDTIGLFKRSSPHYADLALKWLKLMGIEQAANKPLRTVQAREKRLCLLARALVKNPPLLILDEPCQGFYENDKQFFKDLIDSICEISDTTLIYVSHYQDELPSCITHYLNLRKGEKV